MMLETLPPNLNAVAECLLVLFGGGGHVKGMEAQGREDNAACTY